MPQTQCKCCKAHKREDQKKVLCNIFSLALNLQSVRRGVFSFHGVALVLNLRKPRRKYYRLACPNYVVANIESSYLPSESEDLEKTNTEPVFRSYYLSVQITSRDYLKMQLGYEMQLGYKLQI